MKTKMLSQFIFCAIFIMAMSACNVARISKSSTVYQWNNAGSNGVDGLSKLKPVEDKAVEITITENPDYLIIKATDTTGPNFQAPVPIKKATVPAGWRTDNMGSLYFPEAKYDATGEKVYFRYTEFKYGLQAMTILLKFRGNIPQGEIPRIPPMVETGTSFALAYGFKHTWNSYNTEKNIWGKRISTFAVTAGPMIGGSAAELKAASNAPGLVGDRKSAVISYGGFLMIGTGPINIGYAIGADRVLGYGASKWVYGGKVWHGLIVGINLITF
ncbi:hypothetical protein ACTJKN_02590 [Pedobacter sp. 22163]|uniref:hypothetical protein n=1 Tax=Pedobacter sp. 22163 TaxID=3453883 RepID=UPI003F824145